MFYTKEEELEAYKEYEKIISSLKNEDDVFFKFKGHWEDNIYKNKFGRNIVEKGDKEMFIKYYLQEQEIIRDGLNLNIEDILKNEEYGFE